MTPSDRTVRLLLLALVAAWIAFAGWWMWSTGYFVRPFASDAAAYQADVAEFFVALEDEGFIGFLAAGFRYRSGHPPLFPMSAALVAWPFDEPTSRECWFAVALWASLLAFGIFRLARRFGSPLFALGVTAVTLTAPVIYANARPFYPQMPMIAVVIWATETLLRTDGFRVRRATLAFGVWVGLATMVKQLAPLYLIGGALAVFALGLSDRRSRRRVIVNSILGLVALLGIVGTWYPFHIDSIFAYAGAVVGDAGQEKFSSGVPLLSLDRWTYYPIWLVNDGFGIPLALLVVGAATLVGLRVLRGPKDHATDRSVLVLAVNAAVSYVVITIGQVAACSFYVMHLIPLGALLVCRVIADARSKIMRISGAALLVAVAAWNLHLGLWTMDHLPARTRDWGPFRLDPVMNHDLIKYPRVVGASSRPEAEPWPNREWVRRFYDEGFRDRPRVAIVTEQAFKEPFIHHPFVEPHTLRYEAALLRRRLDVVDLRRLGGDQATQLAKIARLDWIIVDERIVPLAQAEDWLRRASIAYQIVDRRTLTWFSTLALLRIERPFDVRRAADSDVVRHASNTSCEVRFENGWTLEAYRASAWSGGAPILITYWSHDPSRGVPPAIVVHANAHAGRTFLGSTRERLTPRDAASAWTTVVFDDVKSAEGEVKWALQLAPEDSPSKRVAITSSSLPVRSDSVVVIQPPTTPK